MKGKLIIFLIVLLILFLPALFIFNLWSGERNLEKTKSFLLAGGFDEAKTTATKSFHSFEKAKAFLSFFSFVGSSSKLENLIETGVGLSKASFYLAKSGNSMKEIVAIILEGKEGDLSEIAGKARLELGLAWKEVSLLKGISKKGSEVDISAIREKIAMAQDIFSILPEVLPKEKRSYLFLLQNNMELRPTGGFIGSYAVSVFENGRLLDFQVNDVYTADGQLKGHVEPPAPIKRYLGEANWFLRDANFDPDFPLTAQKVAWFFEKETGRSVDGVIAVNLLLVQKILKAIGPVKLSDYNEVITADNLFERAEYHSEVGFFPGSTQKRDFLGLLTDVIFQKVKNNRDWLKIAKVIFESLEEKQILISLYNQKVMRVINKYNWDGVIRESPDYLMVVESNLGVNKVNYFLKRKISQKIEIADEIKDQLTVDYENKSPSDVWPGGDYKNYLRVYVPEGSFLEAVKINGDLLSPERIDISSSSGKTVFGFLVKVPVGEKRKVVLNYKIPLSLEKTASYSLLVQKQSGTGNDNLDVLINYPLSLKPLKVSSSALTGPGAILYNTDLSRDRVFSVEFSK